MELVIKTETYHDPNIGDIATLRLCGPIDQKSVQVFESTILDLYRKGICRLVLDLSETKYLNSTGLGLLINIAHKVNVVGGGIRLVNVAEKFKVLFDMLGLESCLPILASHQEALRSLGSGDSPAPAQATTAEPAGEPAPATPVTAVPDQQLEPSLNASEFLMGANVSEQEEAPVEKQAVESSTESAIGLQQASQAETDASMASGIEITSKPEEPEAVKPAPETAISARPAPAQDKPLLRKTLSSKNKAEESKPEPAKPEAPPEIIVAPVQEEVAIDIQPLAKLEAVESRPATPAVPLAPVNIVVPIDDQDLPAVKMPIKQERLAREASKGMPKQKSTFHIIKRKLTARYYDQMNAHKTYPMALLLNLKAIKEDGVHEPETEEPLKNPTVVVIPRFPGCQVVPDRMAVDVSVAKAATEFWITPFTQSSPQGKIPGWVEIHYENKQLDQVAAPFAIVRSTWAKVMGFFTLLLSVLGINSERFQEAWNMKVEENLPLLLQLLQGVGGWRPLLFGLATAALVCTMWFIYRSRERECEPVEKSSSLRMH